MKTILILKQNQLHYLHIFIFNEQHSSILHIFTKRQSADCIDNFLIQQISQKNAKFPTVLVLEHGFKDIHHIQILFLFLLLHLIPTQILPPTIIVLSSMNTKEQHLPPYSILTDPHMYYFLQSPYKLKQLLATQLYQLKGYTLVEINTKLTAAIDPYVADKVRESGVKIVGINESVQEIVNSQKFKAFQAQRERLKKMRVGNSGSGINTPKSNASSKVSQKGGLPNIKGLKEFINKKIL